MSDEQLTIDGGGEPYEGVVKRSRTIAQLSNVQREILTSIRVQGAIRAVEAGLMIHAARTPPCRGIVGARSPAGRSPNGRCCSYASTDGLEAMKRLRERGLVKQRKDKKWTLT